MYSPWGGIIRSLPSPRTGYRMDGISGDCRVHGTNLHHRRNSTGWWRSSCHSSSRQVKGRHQPIYGWLAQRMGEQRRGQALGSRMGFSVCHVPDHDFLDVCVLLWPECSSEKTEEGAEETGALPDEYDICVSHQKRLEFAWRLSLEMQLMNPPSACSYYPFLLTIPSFNSRKLSNTHTPPFSFLFFLLDTPAFYDWTKQNFFGLRFPQKDLWWCHCNIFGRYLS